MNELKQAAFDGARLKTRDERRGNPGRKAMGSAART